MFRYVGLGVVLMLPLHVGQAVAGQAILNTPDKVRGAIQRELEVGAPAEKIEDFLNKYNIDFSWNKYASRYDAVVRNTWPYYGISIQIYVDNKRQYIRAEVYGFYS